MTLDNHEKRLAVLEKLSETCDQQRIDDRARVQRLESKLDKHLETTSASQLETAKAVTRLAGAVEDISEDLKGALQGAALAVSHDQVWKAIGKVGTIVGAVAMVVISAAWAIFIFIPK